MPYNVKDYMIIFRKNRAFMLQSFNFIDKLIKKIIYPGSDSRLRKFPSIILVQEKLYLAINLIFKL